MKVDKTKQKICRLEDICVVRTGRKDANHASDNGEYPFFTCGTNPLKSTTYSFDGENLIIPGNGDIGRCFYYNGKIEAYQRTYVLHLKENSNIDIKYLYLVFKAGWKLFVKNKILGAAMPYIKLGHLNSFPITIYELGVQKAIATELDSIQTMIDGYNALLEDLDALAQSIFMEMFGDPLDNPKGWKKDLLENIVHSKCAISYGIVQPGEDEENGIPVIRPVDLTSTYVSLKGLKKVSPSISNNYRRTILRGDEILLCVRGTTGIVSLATEELKGCNVTRGIVPLYFDSQNRWFIYYCFKSSGINNEIQKHTKGATLKQINIGELRRISFPIPPLHLQQQFAKQVEAIEKQKDLLREQLKDAETLMAERMQYYFS